jgi:hypothetical protein
MSRRRSDRREGGLRACWSGYVVRCGNGGNAPIGYDPGRTRTDDEGKRNSETLPRVVSHR